MADVDVSHVHIGAAGVGRDGAIKCGGCEIFKKIDATGSIFLKILVDTRRRIAHKPPPASLMATRTQRARLAAL